MFKKKKYFLKELHATLKKLILKPKSDLKLLVCLLGIG